VGGGGPSATSVSGEERRLLKGKRGVATRTRQSLEETFRTRRRLVEEREDPLDLYGREWILEKRRGDMVLAPRLGRKGRHWES